MLTAAVTATPASIMPTPRTVDDRQSLVNRTTTQVAYN